jgi:hypothetical protein
MLGRDWVGVSSPVTADKQRPHAKQAAIIALWTDLFAALKWTMGYTFRELVQ